MTTPTFFEWLEVTRLPEEIKRSLESFDRIDTMFMQSWQASLAEAEIRAARGDPDAKDDVEYFRLSLKRQQREREARRFEIITGAADVHWRQ